MTVLSRNPRATVKGATVVAWDGVAVGAWASVLEDADAIVHLAGKRVDTRPTARNIDELRQSRVYPVRAMGLAWQRAHNPPPVWIQLSSLAIYGNAGEAVLTERAPVPDAGYRQMVGVCRAWEAAFQEVARDVPRRVLLRPGITIGGRGDPATERLALLTRLGFGGPVGSGRQWVSWIGRRDAIAVLCRAIDDATMTGTYHVTAPDAVRNMEMMAAFRTALGKDWGVASPELLATIGAWVLGSDPALALTGRRGFPERLLASGFVFQERSFEATVREAIASSRLGTR